MKKNHSSSLFLIVTILIFTQLFTDCRINKQTRVAEREGQKERIERDIRMMKDPALGFVPTDRLITAKEYKDQLIRTEGAVNGVKWTSLGSKNQAGRTKTMIIDANDPSGNTVWAASVGGGLWKTTNINASEPIWAPIDDFFANLAITSMAQDPSNPQTMYFCTGETYLQPITDGIQGLGVWKSINGGASWSQLSSTNNANFNFCQKMIVNSAGVIFVATSSGLRRSADGGSTFTKVLGTGLGITGAASDHCYDVEIAANSDVYASLNGSVHKSTNAGITFGGAQSIPITVGRVELACAPSHANYVYGICENATAVVGIIRTTNGGNNWTMRTEPDDADPAFPNTDFSNTQAWYDLSLAVDPNNRDVLFAGGVDLFKSTDGAGNWTQVSHWFGGFGFQYVHADQHYAFYKPGSSSEAYFCNDGGIFRTTNANAASPTFADKGTNYITIQFYSCAMHPTALNNYFIGGTQDNGSHRFSSGVVQNSVEITGGDGGFCHIDQNQPQYQFTSYVFSEYFRSSDGGNTWNNVWTSGGQFINPTDYDDANNRMYVCDGNNNYKVWTNPQSGSSFTSVSVPSFGGQVSAIKVSPNTNNRVFFGIDNGDIFRLNNAHTTTPTVTNISTGLPAGYLNCIEVETGNDNHLLAVYTNYGVNSIWESTNGGTSWTSVEGNLPDMPIRWALFNPNNSDQAVIATELGVWSTDNLNGAATDWGASNSGLANVRVDMLQLRQSDKLLIAATHGRGLFSSDIFTTPTALFEADKKTSYTGRTINFSSTSYRGTSWSWNFGDGTISSLENPGHAYSSAGKYNVTLTINSGASSVTKNQFIHILPNKGTPFSIADGGGFEVNPDNFGVLTDNGTTWERGNSSVAGKNGTHAGSNAWVTALAGDYVNNTDASLMTSCFNFSSAGTYTLRFWSKFNTENGTNGVDGFRVEYTLNKGATWLPLGTTIPAGWYNYSNTGGSGSSPFAFPLAFPLNEAFFSGNIDPYAQFTRDVSFLSGNSTVAFRIRFKSGSSGTAPGVAIDDFEITGPVNIAVPVTITSFSAYKMNADVMVNWNTENESNIQEYKIERSNDGINFAPIGTMQPRNASQNFYNYPDKISQLPVRPTGNLYYRLKIMDMDGSNKYSAVARVALDGTGTKITIGPNPFRNELFIYTSEEVKKVSLYDMSGKEVFSTHTVSGNKITITRPLSRGTYIARIETANGIQSLKIHKAD